MVHAELGYDVQPGGRLVVVVVDDHIVDDTVVGGDVHDDLESDQGFVDGFAFEHALDVDLAAMVESTAVVSEVGHEVAVYFDLTPFALSFARMNSCVEFAIGQVRSLELWKR